MHQADRDFLEFLGVILTILLGFFFFSLGFTALKKEHASLKSKCDGVISIEMTDENFKGYLLNCRGGN